IMMGGYWAYVTLSFGGWWAWDPVENSSLVPWLIGVAAFHAMVVQKKTSGGHKAALILSVLAFQFVIYSTFLTRSGILGDVSVHSFVDLGLYNQLLLWILSIGVLGFGLFAYRYRELPSPKSPPAMLSRESMIFTGALLLAMVGLVIILGTSAPIFGQLFRDSPSGVPIAFYNAWTIPLAIGIAFLAGLGQLFWWRTMKIEEVNRVLLKPLALTVVSTAGVLLVTPFVEETVRRPTEFAATSIVEAGILPGFLETFFDSHGTSLLLLLLLFTAFFALYGNLFVLFRVARGNLKLAGGSLTHVGFGLVLLGIFASSVFNDPISDGLGTNIQGSRDNFVVNRGQSLAVDGYEVTYVGTELNEEDRPVYLMNWTAPSGETFETRNEVYQDGRGQWIQHPFVREGFFRDLYVAAFPSAMNEQPTDQPGLMQLQRGESKSLNNGTISVRFVDYDLEVDPSEFGFDSTTIDLAVAAIVEVGDASGEVVTVRPVYLITTEREQQIVRAPVERTDMSVAFVGMQPEANAISLVVQGATVDTEEWVVIQAYEKPFISILWLGTIVVLFGFGLAFFRRAGDARR
ncbi:MAG: cytochrome c-type biogenesis CcmF C-terminal domain-containing protein, partial [Rubricoccaceae bacterium]|nr:cytochrome c-type biogenesis CcmF C-terminal domain-containing protein [Rubricoccaceae bacterium]